MILYNKVDGVGIISLNRPKILNPLNSKSFQEISLTLTEVNRDSGIRALVLKGGGNAFSAGGDIKEIESFPPGDVSEFRDFMMVVKKTVLDLKGNIQIPATASVFYSRINPQRMLKRVTPISHSRVFFLPSEGIYVWGNPIPVR